jgi:F-type H+-transporting ATPase subunit gamma
MPTLREVRNRIRSVSNIAKITRALEAVSASRVRRAQARALATRPYAEKAWEILVNIQNASLGGQPLHPLLVERATVRQVMVILITSDRGLAGAYNGNIIRIAQRFADHESSPPVQFVTVGRKGRDSLIYAGARVVAEFESLPDEPTIADVGPIARLAEDAFLNGEVDEVLIAYTEFVNMLAQRPTVWGWLPLTPQSVAEGILASDNIKGNGIAISTGQQDYEYEPDAAMVLEEIVPRFTELQLYSAVLESIACEHAARMAAMRSATENATQLTADLTLVYNKARQAAITGEILDIVGGAAALQQAIDRDADAILRDAAAVPTGSDNLQTIEGIGPVIAGILEKAGVATFAKLAATPVEDLRRIVRDGGVTIMPGIDSWADQARLAATQDWERLNQLQAELVAGRRVN